MMKERYVTPIMEIAHFAAEDVITASNELPLDPFPQEDSFDVK